MSIGWVAVALFGLICFLAGVGAAAWPGQDSAGHWRVGAWRWIVLAVGGLLLCLAGLQLAGVYDIGLHYPGNK